MQYTSAHSNADKPQVPLWPTPCLIALTVLLAIAMLAAPASAGTSFDDQENLVSVYGGLFIPRDRFDTSYIDAGLDAGFSLIRVNEYTGLEMGIHTFYLPNSGGPDAKTIGGELLVHFHQMDVTLQPYFALGLGVYQSEIQTSYGYVSANGTGMVLKLGARYYLSKKYFIGAFYKRFTNNVVVNRTGLNLGGTCLCFEVGIWTR